MVNFKNRLLQKILNIKRDPLSLLISSWDYYSYENILNMTLEEFAVTHIDSKKLRKYRHVVLSTLVMYIVFQFALSESPIYL